MILLLWIFDLAMSSVSVPGWVYLVLIIATLIFSGGSPE